MPLQRKYGCGKWEVGSGLPGLILLLCSANIPLSGFITVCLYRFIEEHLGCLKILAIMNKAARNTCVQVSVWTYVFNTFG